MTHNAKLRYLARFTVNGNKPDNKAAALFINHHQTYRNIARSIAIPTKGSLIHG